MERAWTSLFTHSQLLYIFFNHLDSQVMKFSGMFHFEAKLVISLELYIQSAPFSL